MLYRHVLADRSNSILRLKLWSGYPVPKPRSRLSRPCFLVPTLSSPPRAIRSRPSTAPGEWYDCAVFCSELEDDLNKSIVFATMLAAGAFALLAGCGPQDKSSG